MKKVAFILLVVITILLSIYNVTYASSVDSIISGADQFMQAGKDGEYKGFSWEGITNASDLIYNTLLIIGVIVVVVVGVILGIKYMTSSVEEQAKIKETLIPYVIGSITIFGAFGIWKLVTGILENVN